MNTPVKWGITPRVAVRNGKVTLNTARYPEAVAVLLEHYVRQKPVMAMGDGRPDRPAVISGVEVAGWEEFAVDHCGHFHGNVDMEFTVDDGSSR